MTEFVNDSFVEIPMPGILDGTDHHTHEVSTLPDDAPASDVRDVLERVAAALDRSGEYGRALWRNLAAVAEYLREDVARGRNDQGLLHTEEQWRRWQEIYAEVLSVLAGPTGDSGYGASQAQLEMQNHPSRRPRR